MILLDKLLPLNLECNFAIIPAAIAAIGTVAGTALNGLSTSSANRQNKQTNQMNNEFNAREAEKARAFQLDMWNKQNAYNTPANQRNLRSEAGYNPYFGFDESTGTAGSVGSTSQASAAQPLQVNPMDYSSLASGLARAAQMSYEARQSNAMTDNLQSQKDVNQAHTYQLMSNIDWGKLSPDYRNWLRDTGLQRAQLNYDTDRQNLENLRWTNKIQRAQRTDIMLSNESKRILNKYLDQSEQLRLNVSAAQYYDMMAAGPLRSA